MKDTYTVKELSQILGTNPETIRRWIRGGKLRAQYSEKKGRNEAGIITKEALNDFMKVYPKYAKLLLTAVPALSMLGDSMSVAGSIVAAAGIAATAGSTSKKRQEQKNYATEITFDEMLATLKKQTDESMKKIAEYEAQKKILEEKIASEWTTIDEIHDALKNLLNKVEQQMEINEKTESVSDDKEE